jgi:hypothetical protein
MSAGSALADFIYRFALASYGEREAINLGTFRLFQFFQGNRPFYFRMLLDRAVQPNISLQ